VGLNIDDVLAQPTALKEDELRAHWDPEFHWVARPA
jgi:hypothetical protein